MTTLMAPYQPNMDELRRLVTEHYLTARTHPDNDLTIWNYTPKAMWAHEWNEHTRACRGLILNSRNEVAQRPFPKFFNFGEADAEMWPDDPFDVYEKLDGSLGILYWQPDGPAIATRGSFISDQAKAATAILRERYAHTFADLDRGLTYLFEILLPENRIVVDYGGQRDLVLLAVIDTATGVDLPLSAFAGLGFPIVQKHEGHTLESLLAAMGSDEQNREGFVVHFPSTGLRLKVKLSEYMRLHRIVTGITPLRIWEWLRDGADPWAEVTGTPDHFHQWMREQIASLRRRYTAIEDDAAADLQGVPGLDEHPIPFNREARAIAAAYITKQEYPGVLFRMLDGESYADLIWKMLRPKAAQPFRQPDE